MEMKHEYDEISQMLREVPRTKRAGMQYILVESALEFLNEIYKYPRHHMIYFGSRRMRSTSRIKKTSRERDADVVSPLQSEIWTEVIDGAPYPKSILDSRPVGPLYFKDIGLNYMVCRDLLHFGGTDINEDIINIWRDGKNVIKTRLYPYDPEELLLQDPTKYMQEVREISEKFKPNIQSTDFVQAAFIFQVVKELYGYEIERSKAY